MYSQITSFIKGFYQYEAGYKLKNKSGLDEFLRVSNDPGVMARPSWQPTHNMGLYGVQPDCLFNTDRLAECLVNMPSSLAINSSELVNFQSSAEESEVLQ